MAKAVHCPNPGCTHVFAAEAVAGVAALVCPQCGGVFQVRSRPASGRQPDVSGISNLQSLTRRANAPTLARRLRAPLAWTVAGLLVVAGLSLAAVKLWQQYQPVEPTTPPEPFRSAEYNYSFLLPGPAWRRDADLAKQLGGVLAFRRSEPDAAVVLAVRHYPKYVPTSGELREEAVARLRKFPFANLQHEDKSDGATLAGRPAGRFVFQAALADTIVSGDVLYLTHQGAAYWFYRWCPAAAVRQAAAGLGDLADRFALLDERPDWRPPLRTFAGEKLKYTLTAEGDRWEKAAYPATNYDPAADVALVGQEREGMTDAARQALTLVVVLPPGEGTPAERARAHVLARQKEVYEGTTLADLPPERGAVEGPVLTLKVVNTKDRERFAVLRVVGPVLLWAECDYTRRQFWEAEFRKLLGSYKPAE